MPYFAKFRHLSLTVPNRHPEPNFDKFICFRLISRPLSFRAAPKSNTKESTRRALILIYHLHIVPLRPAGSKWQAIELKFATNCGGGLER